MIKTRSFCEHNVALCSSLAVYIIVWNGEIIDQPAVSRISAKWLTYSPHYNFRIVRIQTHALTVSYGLHESRKQINSLVD